MNLRQRMVAAALVPVGLVAAALTAFFVWQHLDDLDRGLVQRGDGVARQAAEMSEFNLFSGDRERLQATIQALLRTDADLRAVSVLDGREQILAQAGSADRASWPPPGSERARTQADSGVVIRLPVIPKTLAVDDAYSGTDFALASRSREVLGHVVVEMSGRRLAEDRRHLILAALATAVAGMMLGGLLALRIARTVTAPVIAATDVVTRIGHGDIRARLSLRASGALQDLAKGINAMAERVAMTQESLESQVRAATTELVRQRDAAEEATDAKSRFLAAASHDLRQPLHAMGLFVARLQSLSLGGEAQGLVRQVDASVTTLQDMLETLLDLSRLEAGGLRVDLCDFDLAAVLARVCRDLSPVAHDRQLELRLRTGPARVHGDPRLVARVALNLVSNALRYSVQGRVLVACRPRGEMVRLQVWDTGVGIPAGLQSRIFEEYVQVGNDERDRGKGLGLGLTICRRIARLLGTDIGLRSVPGKGSVFWIDLPAAHSVEPAPATLPEGDAAVSGAVLVVDDDPLCRSGTADLIAGWGVAVRSAATAEEARELLGDRAFAPRYAICDIRLPGGEDGIALGQRLTRERPGLEVILVSADVSPVILARARRAGFPLLRKPVPPARLRAALLSRQAPPSA